MKARGWVSLEKQLVVSELDNAEGILMVIKSFSDVAWSVINLVNREKIIVHPIWAIL